MINKLTWAATAIVVVLIIAEAKAGWLTRQLGLVVPQPTMQIQRSPQPNPKTKSPDVWGAGGGKNGILIDPCGARGIDCPKVVRPFAAPDYWKNGGKNPDGIQHKETRPAPSPAQHPMASPAQHPNAQRKE